MVLETKLCHEFLFNISVSRLKVINNNNSLPPLHLPLSLTFTSLHSPSPSPSPPLSLPNYLTMTNFL